MRKIEISDETYDRIKDQLEEEDEDCYCDIEEWGHMIGKKFFFRTVTYHAVGRVVKWISCEENFIELSDASWVADSGRFMNAIKEGVLSEVEPVGTMWINLNSVVDFFPWKHDLPTEQK